MRMHNSEMFLVSVTHNGSQGPTTSMLCLSDDLEIALNAARTAEKFGYEISGFEDGALIWSFNPNVSKTDRVPIFERRWRYTGKSSEGKSWIETWNSQPHKNLVENISFRSTK